MSRTGLTRFALTFLLPLAVGCGSGEDTGSTSTDSATSGPAETAQNVSSQTLPADLEHLTADIEKFCGACHAMPQPQSFPREAWYDEVKRGFNFYYDSGRRDLTPPPQAAVVSWFRDRAPEKLPLPEQTESPSKTLTFRSKDLVASDFSADGPLAVSFVNPLKIANEDGIWISDMRSGIAGQLKLTSLDFQSAETPLTLRLDQNFKGIVANPAAVRDPDLDGNGVADLVFSDLGSFLPQDHDRGKVVWIPDGTQSTNNTPITILEKIGRVADLLPIDINSDGDLDLVVGSFGWHKTGGVYVLHNERHPQTGAISFRSEKIDERPGTIHVLPADLNKDARPDFIALISQEHEEITGYLNLESGFEKQVIYEAPDPSWGSSGIQQVDLDQDGDQDLIYTNGDTFDSYVVKPYHGVWFLENTGTLPYVAQHVAAMPGVHRAIAHDLDGDGDLDIAAAALLPSASARGVDVSNMHSVVWLEQTAARTFERHVISKGRPTHAALFVSDVNKDGRPDLVVGSFREEASNTAPVVTVYLNEAITKITNPSGKAEGVKTAGAESF